jgi:hypothetical protein
MSVIVIGASGRLGRLVGEAHLPSYGAAPAQREQHR